MGYLRTSNCGGFEDALAVTCDAFAAGVKLGLTKQSVVEITVALVPVTIQKVATMSRLPSVFTLNKGMIRNLHATCATTPRVTARQLGQSMKIFYISFVYHIDKWQFMIHALNRLSLPMM